MNSFLPTDERGVVNDYVHNTNVVSTQQKSIVIVIGDLGLEKPNVDCVHVFQNKMMVQAAKPNKDVFVVTLLWASVGVKPNTWKK